MHIRPAKGSERGKEPTQLAQCHSSAAVAYVLFVGLVCTSHCLSSSPLQDRCYLWVCTGVSYAMELHADWYGLTSVLALFRTCMQIHQECD